MKRLSATLLGSALGLLLAGAAARANPTPASNPPTVTVTENWSPNLFKVYAQGYDPTTDPNNHFISFTNETAHTIDVPTQFSGLLPNQVLATNLNAVTSATFATPDKVSTDYTLSLTLTGSGGATDTATLIYTGHLDATFYNYKDSNNVQHTYFNGSNQYTSPISQQAQLDGSTLTVTLDPFAHPTTGSTNNGSIGAQVTANFGGGGGGPGPGDGGGPGPTGTPEPSGLVLAFVGLSGLGAASWRKWRARTAA